MSKSDETKTESAPVDVPKSTPVEPGEPVEQIAVSQMGSTFAERAAARAKVDKALTRGGRAGVEDKAVARKKAAKKAGK